MKDFLKNYGGIIAGAFYALFLRIIFNVPELFLDLFSLFSVTFVWVTPIIIGLIPFLFATNEQFNDWKFRVFRPVGAVLTFFVICFITKLEDLLCLFIIAVPFLLGALTAGLILGAVIKRFRIKKGTFYSIVLLPFVLCPMEQQFEKPVSEYSVIAVIVIDASPEEVWENVVRVSEIGEDEYSKGFFNYAGIPRPLYAELDRDTLGVKLIGHFEGGLRFVETVTSWRKFECIGFDIEVVPSSIRQTIFDQHILMGNHFKFTNAEYRLTSVEGKTVLRLSSSYRLNSNVNGYGAYCGNMLLMDFQERLLDVIKGRCELR